MKEKEENQSSLEWNRYLQEIEKRAYESSLERIRENRPGDRLSDWYKAEREIKAKYGLSDGGKGEK